MRTFTGTLALRTVVAIASTGSAFWLGSSPTSSAVLGDLGRLAWHVLDAPASALNLLLPGSLRSGFAMQFESSTYCFPESTGVELGRYLLVGVPAWLCVLYLGAGSVAGFRSARRSWKEGHAAR